MRMLTLVCVFLAFGALASAQPKSLLYFSMYDSKSLDTNAVGALADFRPFDLAVVTPGANATAHPLMPAAGISATMGDPNGDGVFAEFNGLPQGAWGLGSPFVKWDEKTSTDPRRVFWTIREASTTVPTIQVFEGTSLSTVRVGDWVRITDVGEAEFFIKQEHFLAAMGLQSGAHVVGATAMCQAANKDLYYCPAHGISGGSLQGGHWVSTGSGLTFAFDGAICRIPAGAITYDPLGNVSSIVPGSARLVMNETGAGPNMEPSTRTMVQNSSANDSIGNKCTITFMMNGLEIDPNGGTWTGWFGNTHPNLIFTFENPATSCCGGPWGSWMGTVFSTSGLGTIARINGRQMGVTTGMADGSWTGLTAASGSANAPITRGLAWVDSGYQSTAPYGNATLQTANDGLIVRANDPNARLYLQAPEANQTNVFFLGFGAVQGGRPLSVDLTPVVAGYGSVYVLNQGPVQLVGTTSNAAGQSSVTIPVPLDQVLTGLPIVWQAYCVTSGTDQISNPVVTEIR